MSNKVVIWVDGSNFYYKLKDLGLYDQCSFDFLSFGKYLANGSKIIDYKYYVGAVRVDGSSKSKKMHADQ